MCIARGWPCLQQLPPFGPGVTGAPHVHVQAEASSAAFRSSGRYGGPTLRRTHANPADAAAAGALKELQRAPSPTTPAPPSPPFTLSHGTSQPPSRRL